MNEKHPPETLRVFPLKGDTAGRRGNPGSGGHWLGLLCGLLIPFP